MAGHSTEQASRVRCPLPGGDRSAYRSRACLLFRLVNLTSQPYHSSTRMSTFVNICTRGLHAHVRTRIRPRPAFRQPSVEAASHIFAQRLSQTFSELWALRLSLGLSESKHVCLWDVQVLRPSRCPFGLYCICIRSVAVRLLYSLAIDLHKTISTIYK